MTRENTRENTSGRDLALRILVLAVAALSIFKGFNPNTQIWGAYNWYLDYSAGFVKRGLLGTIFGALFDRSDTSYLFIVTIYHAVLVAGVAYVATRLLQTAFRSLGLAREAWAAALVLAASPTFGTLAYNNGYLDTTIIALLLGGVLLLNRGSFVAAGLLSVVGVLVHEAFLFLWLPVLAAWGVVIWRSKSGKLRTPTLLFAIAFTSGLTTFFHSDQAAETLLQSAPMAENVRDAVLNFNLGASLQQALSAVLPKYVAVPRNVLYSAAFFLAPSFVVAVWAWRPLRHFLDAEATLLVLFILALGPLAVLLVAWDLSRFLTLSPIVLAAGLYVVARHFRGGMHVSV